LPAPAHPAEHIAFYTAVMNFLFDWSILACAALCASFGKALVNRYSNYLAFLPFFGSFIAGEFFEKQSAIWVREQKTLHFSICWTNGSGR
jgi:hypothetical protein